MEGLLNQAADGSSRGLKLWYAINHAARCTGCGNYLRRLRETVGRLHSATKEMPPTDVLNRLEAAIPREEGIPR